MNLPPEFFSTPLNHPEFRLIVSLYHLSGPERLVDATMVELEVLTGMGAESLRKALRGLEKANLIETKRTKRNLGKYSKNVYTLLPSHENEGLVELPPLENEGSTGNYMSGGLSKLYKPLVPSTTTTNKVIRGAFCTQGSEETVSPVWKDPDDGVGGFGLFEEELEAKITPAKINRLDPKTRGHRPQQEWTPTDVATEFSQRLKKKYPFTPGMVNVRDLSGALTRNRKDYDMTPLVELEVMEMFFEDERNLRTAKENCALAHRAFLQFFKFNTEKAMDRLGLDTPVRVPDGVEQSERYVYAPDGRKFDNSMAGRKAMERHTLTLKENA